MLETQRLFIREWRESDVGHYLNLATDIGYNVFAVPGQFLVKDETEALQKIKQKQNLYEQTGLGKFLIFLKSSDELIGSCGIKPYIVEGQNEIELGYRLLLKHWGRGYATEAASAILQYGIKQLCLPRIIAFALPQNLQSLKIIEKLKFRFLRTFEHIGIEHRLYVLTTAQL